MSEIRRVSPPSTQALLKAQAIQDRPILQEQQATPIPRKCFAYCTAKSYNLKNLYQVLTSGSTSALPDISIVHTVLRSDYLYAQLQKKKDCGDNTDPTDMFFFKEGSVVSWNSEKSLDEQILQTILTLPASMNVEIDPHEEALQDDEEMTYFDDPNR
jgi:uncharacterized Rmd1/YagE family protein